MLPIVLTLCYLAVLVVILAGFWKVFVKAGQPGWACLIPIYNCYILLKIVGRPTWWLLLLLIPFVNFVIAILLALDLAKSFGKGTGFAIGLLLLGFIFYPILGFGSATYQGPAVKS
jgi:hypothetical protein